MERRLNFEGVTSHRILKAKQSNDLIEKILYPRFIKSAKKMNLLALSGNSMESYYDRSHRFNKNIIIFMVFVTYKYLNVEIKHLEIIST